MPVKKRHIVYFFLALADVVLILASYYVASWAYLVGYKAAGAASTDILPLWSLPGSMLVLVYACSLVALYAVWSVYGNIYLGFFRKAAKRILLINVIGITTLLALLFLLHLEQVSRISVLLFFLISTFVVLLKQYITRRIFYLMRKGRQETLPVLVIGCGSLAQGYADALSASEERIESVIGYISSGRSAQELNVETVCPALKQRLGDIADLDDVLAKNPVYSIVIALDASNYKYITYIVRMANKYGTKLALVPFYNEIIPRKPEVDSVKGINLINLRSIPLDNPFKAAIKRIGDIIISLFVIVITSPLMLITAIGVRLSSPGPILYRQIRTGRNGKSFDMLKFRSMRVAGDDNISTFTEDKEARKTKFGAFIRKFSIDELPQFFNVVKGEMSIIGPRPVVLEETTLFRDAIPLYMLRHQIRPGISGWAQIHGYRGGTEISTVEKRTELDLWYIQHWTPILDALIFIRTLFGGFVNGEKLK